MANRKLKLDLACGQAKRKGFKGVDCVAGPGVDYVFNLETYPWPFEDNSVDEIFCAHYVEHCRDLVKFMDEVWRICKDETIVTIFHPYWSSNDAWRDPTHVRALNEESWNYYSQAWLKSIGMDHYGSKADFEITNINYNLSGDEFYNMPEEERDWHIKHSMNVVRELGVTLRARK